jgi:hypothetical protein
LPITATPGAVKDSAPALADDDTPSLEHWRLALHLQERVRPERQIGAQLSSGSGNVAELTSNLELGKSKA